MASFVLTDAHFTINSVNLSDHVQSITINYSAELQDETVMGDDSRIRIAGLKDWSVEVTFKQNYAASKVDATLFGLVGAAAFAIAIRSSDTNAVGATNPEYQGNAVLESYQPFGQAVGELASAPITLQGAGTLVRAVA